MEIFLKGGIILVFIILLSVFAIALIIERFIFYNSVRIRDKKLLDDIVDFLRKGKLELLRKRLQEINTPEARILLTGLQYYGYDLEKIKAEMEARALKEMSLMEKNVSYLSNIANVATLLGLLGTVTGMIISFFNMKASGISDPAVLAGGIAQALITTAAGLSVAIPSLFFYHIFSNIVNKHATDMEIISSEYLSFITSTYKHGIV